MAGYFVKIFVIVFAVCCVLVSVFARFFFVVFAPCPGNQRKKYITEF